ncbi:hypothetical protein ACQI4L_09825 [Mycolicibacterium litorale]|uniref:hypothetical protein n=1 Tax=Mycolicibacterium litorale TaxID=758802 RepID=UPI003CEC12AB
MSINVTNQQFGGGGRWPAHGFQEARPEDLPGSAAIWDAAAKYGRNSEAVAAATYQAVKALESELVELRTTVQNAVGGSA